MADGFTISSDDEINLPVEIKLPPGLYSISQDETGNTHFDYTPISEHGVN